MNAQSIRTALAVLLLLSAGAPLCTVAQSSSVKQPSPADGTGAYATGHYRNLLAEAGHTDAEINARLEATFQQLFHGDKNTQAIYYAVGSNANGPLGYVTDVANHDARTEGMSYGMMIAVQTNHKAEFDAIWNWANTYMLITDPNNPSVGYYAWSMNVDGTPRSDSPAPDGEEYFVMSLYFAAHRWGNGTGLYNYQAQADRILSLMRHHPVLTATGPFRIHPEDPPFVYRRRPPVPPATSTTSTATPAQPAPTTPPAPRPTTVGPMVSEQANMILFVPGQPRNDFSDPSYHLPHFYELWARWGPAEDRAFWAKAAETSRQYFVEATNPTTGLAPDYASFDGTPHASSFNDMSGNFSYDSWRTASNWGVDQAWFGKNPDARHLSDHIQAFLFAQGIHTFADRYTLDGKPLSTRHSVGMVATTATTGLAATDGPVQRAFVDELWNTPTPSGEQRYYDGMLTLLNLLHTSGHFRIWMPPAQRSHASPRRTSELSPARP